MGLINWIIDRRLFPRRHVQLLLPAQVAWRRDHRRVHIARDGALAQRQVSLLPAPARGRPPPRPRPAPLPRVTLRARPVAAARVSLRDPQTREARSRGRAAAAGAPARVSDADSVLHGIQRLGWVIQ